MLRRFLRFRAYYALQRGRAQLSAETQRVVTTTLPHGLLQRGRAQLSAESIVYNNRIHSPSCALQRGRAHVSAETPGQTENLLLGIHGFNGAALIERGNFPSITC